MSFTLSEISISIVIFTRQFSFLEPNKVQELRRKCERMLSFYTYELVTPSSKDLEGLTIPSVIYEDVETLNKMTELISVLGNLSMFYTYNTNWGYKNLPGYSKPNSKVVSEKLKTGPPQEKALGTTGTYVFH